MNGSWSRETHAGGLATIEISARDSGDQLEQFASRKDASDLELRYIAGLRDFIGSIEFYARRCLECLCIAMPATMRDLTNSQLIPRERRSRRVKSERND